MNSDPMTWLQWAEALSYLVTIFGLPMAILVFMYEQRHERQGEQEELYQRLSDEYTGFLKLVLGNPELSPEQSLSFDVGLRWARDMHPFSGNLYYSTYHDLIDALEVAPRTYQYTNVAEARIYGAEAEGEFAVRRDW